MCSLVCVFACLFDCLLVRVLFVGCVVGRARLRVCCMVFVWMQDVMVGGDRCLMLVDCCGICCLLHAVCVVRGRIRGSWLVVCCVLLVLFVCWLVVGCLFVF